MQDKNFLQRLISHLSPQIFRPVPEGLLYIFLQSISREMSGICPWDEGDQCQKGFTQFWVPNCRVTACPGYRSPVGLIAYTSESDILTSVDNAFDFSSFRYLTSDDFVSIGTFGAKIKIDFSPSTVNVVIGDSWTITCVASTGAVGPALANPANQGSYGAVSTYGTYIGTHDTTYTVTIIDYWGYIQNYNNALLQMCLATCDGVWVDFWGAYFGLQRQFGLTGYETDDDYKTRIMKEITRAKGTKAVLLDEAIRYFKSSNTAITEYCQINTNGSVVKGSDNNYYTCIVSHTSDSTNEPITGVDWTAFWVLAGASGPSWANSTSYTRRYGWDGLNTGQNPDGTAGNWTNVDGTITKGTDRAGLMPYQFYINPPVARSPSAKYVKDGTKLIIDGIALGQVYNFDGAVTFTQLDAGDDMFPAKTAGNACYFGNPSKFSGIYVNLATPGAGGSYIWEYWNGSGWSALVPDSTMKDLTAELTASGWVWVWWLVPSVAAEWQAADAVSGQIPTTGTKMFWIRVRILTTITTIPNENGLDLSYASATNRGHYCGTQYTDLSIANQPQSVDVVWKGAWEAATQYYVNDFVTDSGVGYLCNTKHISAGTFGADAGDWTASGGVVGIYSSTHRDKNNCYIYLKGSWEKPLWQSGLQEIIDRLKTAGTIAIINPK
jgi:hypothetical protein